MLWPYPTALREGRKKSRKQKKESCDEVWAADLEPSSPSWTHWPCLEDILHCCWGQGREHQWRFVADVSSTSMPEVSTQLVVTVGDSLNRKQLQAQIRTWQEQHHVLLELVGSA